MQKHVKTPLYFLSERLISALDKRRPGIRSIKSRQEYIETHNGEFDEESWKKERSAHAATVLRTALISLLIIIAVLIVNISKPKVLQGYTVERPSGFSEKQLKLNWSAKDIKNGSGTMDFSVNPVKPSESAIEAMFAQCEDYIRSLYKDRTIRGSFSMPENIPGTLVKVGWETEERALIYADGTLNQALLSEDTTAVIKVRLSAFEAIYEFNILVRLGKRLSDETFSKRLEDYVHTLNRDTAGAGIELPSEFEGVALTWRESKSYDTLIIILICLSLPVLVYFSYFQKQKQMLQKRKKELMNDYPELVSKLLLLLEAGLTVRGAIERLSLTYRNNVEKGTQKRRAAYDEFSIAAREIQNGISVAAACENLGKRCKLLPYLRLAGLLKQNLIKGANSVIPMLEQEAVTAFEERKENAKKRGEEAGTKLLFPMLGMLVIVLVIIIYPAFTRL